VKNSLAIEMNYSFKK